MATGAFCGVAPFLFRKKGSAFQGKAQSETCKTFSSASKKIKDTKGSTIQNSSGVAGNFVTMTKLRNKISTFRDLLDFTPCVGSASVNELLVWTLNDLFKLHPNLKPNISSSEIKNASMYKALVLLCDALKSLGDMWTTDNWMVKCKYKPSMKLEQTDLEQTALVMLEDVIKLARERLFDEMDDDEEIREYGPPTSQFEKTLSESYSDNYSMSFSGSPATPTSVLSQAWKSSSGKSEKMSYSPPRLLPLRVQAVGKLNPIDLKRLSFHMFPNKPEKEEKRESEACEIKGGDVKVDQEDETMEDVEKTDEVDNEFDMQVDTPKVVKAGSVDVIAYDGRKWIDASAIELLPTLDTLPKLRSKVIDWVEPILPSALPNNEIQSQIPVPTIPNEIPSSPVSTPLVPDAPTLPPPLSPITSVPSPPPPPPIIPPSLVAPPSPPPHQPLSPVISAPPPPLPPPSLVAPPPPPSLVAPPRPLLVSSTNIASPPPPPLIITSANKASPPPPPPMALTSSAPPPPPPPIIASKGLIPSPSPLISLPSRGGPPPPPPPMVASKGSIPPPPPLMVTNGASPPPLSPLMGAKAPQPPPMSIIGAPPPPPPLMGAKGPPPPPMSNIGTPPPPPGFGGALRPKKATTKLKRSAQMGNLYRLLKGKVEGSSLDGKAGGRKSKIGAPTGGKQGMADALAEMTKRSAYFQQIEEDVKNYSGVIKEVKAKISSFQTSDMNELKKFHKYVESHLEKLTDESQVLSRFEDFPGKKLEALRMAAALYTKLDTIVNTLQNWPIVSPVGQLIDKSESYFNKIKQELDALERTKDEEAKRFQAQKITFDFGILIRIKELIVDISSHCMELALKEKREAMANGNEDSKPGTKKNGSGKMLWRAFQFAFRVYTFAGGHDDRADKLTRELAQEIETDPLH